MPATQSSHPFGGIYAATICPMNEAGAIDEMQLERHLENVLAAEGMTGLLVNGHAGENFALDQIELARVVGIARRVAGRGRVVAGVNAECSEVAAAMAADASKAGADAIMVFPPFSWALGADDRAIQVHHRAVASASGVPLFLFQGSVNAGRTAYGPYTLARLLEIEAVVGIKEGSWETAAYDATRRQTKSLRPDVAVMASGDEHLFACFAIGSEGSLVSLAAVVPELVVGLDRTVRDGDLAAARELHERLYLLAKTVYAKPGHLATVRLKTCLMLLNRISSARCRQPVGDLSAEETEALRMTLVAAGIMN